MKKDIASLFIFGSLIFLVSCGEKSSGPRSSLINAQQEIQEEQGLYRAIVTPLNVATAGQTRGTFIIRVNGDEIVVEGAVTGAPAGVKHLQSITTGGGCPTAESDLNADGHVDFLEGMHSYGNILVPLDSNLNSQDLGTGYGPIANNASAYVYRETASLKDMLEDLWAIDPNPSDEAAKLTPNAGLELSGKRIIIHGVGVALPTTVGTTETVTNSESLPIACGEIIKISSEDDPTGLTES